jgi:hypothetical protein
MRRPVPRGSGLSPVGPPAGCDVCDQRRGDAQRHARRPGRRSGAGHLYQQRGNSRVQYRRKPRRRNHSVPSGREGHPLQAVEIHRGGGGSASLPGTRAPGGHRQPVYPGRAQRHQTHANGARSRRGRVRPHARLCGHRFEPRARGRRGRRAPPRSGTGKDRGTLHPRGEEHDLEEYPRRDFPNHGPAGPPRPPPARPCPSLCRSLGRVGKAFFSCEKAKSELGFHPRPVGEGLRDAVEWFRSNGYCR